MCRRSRGGAGARSGRSGALRARARGCARRARACWREARTRVGAVGGRQAGGGIARSRASAAASCPAQAPALREVQGPAPGGEWVRTLSGEREVAGGDDSRAEPQPRRPAGGDHRQLRGDGAGAA